MKTTPRPSVNLKLLPNAPHATPTALVHHMSAILSPCSTSNQKLTHISFLRHTAMPSSCLLASRSAWLTSTALKSLISWLGLPQAIPQVSTAACVSYCPPNTTVRFVVNPWPSSNCLIMYPNSSLGRKLAIAMDLHFSQSNCSIQGIVKSAP